MTVDVIKREAIESAIVALVSKLEAEIPDRLGST